MALVFCFVKVTLLSHSISIIFVTVWSIVVVVYNEKSVKESVGPKDENPLC